MRGRYSIDWNMIILSLANSLPEAEAELGGEFESCHQGYCPRCSPLAARTSCALAL